MKFILTTFFLTISILSYDVSAEDEIPTYHLKFLSWMKSENAMQNTVLMFDIIDEAGEKAGFATLGMPPGGGRNESEKKLMEYVKSAYAEHRVVFISIQSPALRRTQGIGMTYTNTDITTWKPIDIKEIKANKAVVTTP